MYRHCLSTDDSLVLFEKKSEQRREKEHPRETEANSGALRVRCAGRDNNMNRNRKAARLRFRGLFVFFVSLALRVPTFVSRPMPNGGSQIFSR